MEVVHILAKSSHDITAVVKKVKYSGKLGLCATIQHVHQLKDVQKLLPGSVVCGQILGCDATLAKRFSSQVDAFLFIGSGDFHPLEVALETGKEVVCANPYNGEVSYLLKDEVERRRRRMKAGLAKFLMSKRIGILVSTKSGQGLLRKALQLKERVVGKEFYIFLFDTLHFQRLEDFPDIECWVNTACSRIALEDYEKFNKPVVNYTELYPLYHQEHKDG